MEQVQSRGQRRRPVRSVAVSERLYLHSSLSLVRCRMCRPVRTVAVPERSSKTSARIAGVPDTLQARKRFRCRFRQVSTTDRAYPGEGRAGNQRRTERRSARRGCRIETSEPAAAGYEYLFHRTDFLCPGSTWRRDPYSYGGRRCVV